MRDKPGYGILGAMSQAVPKQLFTLEEYLAIEPEGNVRHEFVDGELYAMTGTSRAHNIITVNLTAAIRPHLRGTPCRVVSTDMKVVIAAANRGYYPDLLVSCSDPADEIDSYTETQPRLVIEVLSPSTEAFDRSDKSTHYRRIDSLQDFVLVAQTEPLVEVYNRQAGGWTHTVYGPGGVVTLASIDLCLPMAVIYEDVPLASTTPTRAIRTEQ